MYLLRLTRLTAFLALPLLLAAVAPAQYRVLFIGNSFTFGERLGEESDVSVPAIFHALAVAGGQTEPIVNMSAVGGRDFQYHAGLDGNNFQGTLNAMTSQAWTHIILQNYSTEPTHIVDGTHSISDHLAFGGALYLEAMNLNPKPKVILYETWARSAINPIYTGSSTATTFINPEEFQDEIWFNYRRLADLVNQSYPANPAVTLSPVGDAWMSAGAMLPSSSPNFIDLFAGDEYHGNHSGYYLSACVFYAKIYGASPVGLHNQSAVQALGLNVGNASFLEQIAWAIVTSEAEPLATYLLDFGDTGTPTGHGPAPDDAVYYWNNVTQSIGTSASGFLADLVRADSTGSSVGFVVLSPFAGANTAGSTASTLFPANATRDSLFGNTESFNGVANVFPRFNLTGLNPARVYSLTFFASRTGVSDNRATRYRAVGTSENFATLDAANNANTAATVFGIRPTQSGEIRIEITPDPANSNVNHFTYLNALRVEEHATDSQPLSFIQPPTSVTTTEGLAAAFSAIIAGSPPYTISWRRNGTTIAGANQLSLTIPVTTLAMNGDVFTLVVSNAANTIQSGDATLAVQSLPTVIPRTNWTLHFVDSQELVGESGGATRAFDGNSGTYWVTQWLGGTTAHPHEIQINLGAMYAVNGFRYMPRQGSTSNGRVAQYQFYVSTDGATWGSPVATGTFPNSAVEQQVLFAAKTGQYIRLVALSEVNGYTFTAVAELNVLQGAGGPPPPNQAPNGVISAPTSDVTITAGQTVTFNGSGSDPDNNTPLTFLWNFGTGSGIANATAQNPGSIQFNNPGTFTVSLTVTDSLGLADPTPATRTVTVNAAGGTPTLIPRTNWSLHFVDSQELVGESGAATRAFDGNSGTYWVTQWLNGTPTHPHEIQINLGATYPVAGFRYLPRQGSTSNGRVAQYQFYVSTDGATWGSPVATGTFPNSTVEQQVLFAAKAGQYIRLVALSEVNGYTFTAVAELNALQGAGGPPPNQAPDGVISAPAANVTIAVGQTVTFNGSGSDPDNNTPLAYLWNFGTSSGIANATAQNPGSIQFNNPGTFTVSLTVTDSLSLADPTPATRTVTVNAAGGTPTLIPRTNWSLHFVDSQELVGESGGATRAFDGNSGTYWVTQWLGGTTAHPHEIQIHLGATYPVTGFRYLPRQGSTSNGRVAQYQFYVSTDGATWGSPVATGTFPNSAVEQQVLFAAKSGQYIRLVALSEVNGYTFTAVAELNALSGN